MFDQLWKKVVAVSVGIAGFMGFLGAIAGVAGWFKVEPESLFGNAIAPFIFILNWLSSWHSLPGWLILFSCVALVLLAYQIISLLLSRSMSVEPRFKRYTRDKIHDVDCAWMWDFYNHPVALKFYCDCGNELDFGHLNSSRLGVGLGCYRCKRSIKNFYDISSYHDAGAYFVKEIERIARKEHGLPTHP